MLSERELIAEYGRKMSSAGLCPGTSGNLSVYDARSGLMAVSPSGIDYFETRPEDVVVMELDGKIAEGERKPSSEWGLHAGFYRAKPDAPGQTQHGTAIAGADISDEQLSEKSSVTPQQPRCGKDVEKSEQGGTLQIFYPLGRCAMPETRHGGSDFLAA